MSRLSQIRFAFFLLLCMGIFALQIKRVLDLERPATPPETVTLAVDKIAMIRSGDLVLVLTVPEAYASKINAPAECRDGGHRVSLTIPAKKCPGAVDGKYDCELILYPTGETLFSRLVPVNKE